MPSTSIRPAVKARLVELLKVNAGDVQVAYGWPGKDLADECIYLGATVGPVTIRNMRAGRSERDDSFDLDVHFLAGKPQQEPQQAEERLAELEALLEDVLATYPTLEVDGVLWAAQLGGTVENDNVPTPEGYAGLGTVQVNVKTRLS